MIAALFVDKNGIYFGLPNVEVWDEKKDARLYRGPYSIIAHPPCTRWCRLAGLVEARWGYKKGEDEGCFESALSSVRKWGGVLEHPAYSKAWNVFDLPKPNRNGGWQKGFCGGYACHVEQGRYGHPAKKATWLYAFNTDLPVLKWGFENDNKSEALVSWCGNKTKKNYTRKRLSSKQASATPLEFRNVLIEIAESSRISFNRSRFSCRYFFYKTLIERT